MRVGDIQEVAWRRMRGAGFDVKTSLDVLVNGKKLDENSEVEDGEALASAICATTGHELSIAVNGTSITSVLIINERVPAKKPTPPPAPPAPPPVDEEPTDEE
jgi:hypothetical protein